MKFCHLHCGHCLLINLMLGLSPIHLKPCIIGKYQRGLFLTYMFYACSLIFLFILFISFGRTCPISCPKRKTLPWTSFFRAKAAARWLSYSTNMYLVNKSFLNLKSFFFFFAAQFLLYSTSMSQTSIYLQSYLACAINAQSPFLHDDEELSPPRFSFVRL